MSSYSISHIIRQNPWQKATNERDVVEDLQSIHCPHGHSEDRVESYKEYPDGSTLPPEVRRFISELEIGAIVLVPQSKSTAGDPILVVRIESGPIAGAIKGVGVICRERSCGHEHLMSSCASCDRSIERVILLKDLSDREKLELMMNRGKKRHIEPFIALTRKVTIIGQVSAPPKGDLVRPWYYNWKSPQSISMPKTLKIPYSDVTKTPAQRRRDGDDIVDFLSA
jgi:hypothetical protein